MDAGRTLLGWLAAWAAAWLERFDEQLDDVWEPFLRDDVEVAAAPSPRALALSEPTNGLRLEAQA